MSIHLSSSAAEVTCLSVCRPSSVDKDSGVAVVELGYPRVLAGERGTFTVLSEWRQTAAAES